MAMRLRHTAGDRQPTAFEPPCCEGGRLMAMRHAAGDRKLTA
jgi:hypothetical protein